MTTIGILRETKSPPDKRVALTPDQIVEVERTFLNCKCIVQPSDIRGFSDDEYRSKGITVQDDVSKCDILIGVKEVDINALLPDRTYIFFSHTAKEQPHNKKLIQAILKKKITLIDYEYLTDDNNIRLVAFGRWAGIVGGYNGLRAYGLRNKHFTLKPAYQCFDKKGLFRELEKVLLPPVKLLITGGGRVASGVKEVLEQLKIKQVSPRVFLNNTTLEAVYCQIEPEHYTRRTDGSMFDFSHFVAHPDQYESTFYPYVKVTDVLFASHFWDPRSPVFFTKNEMKSSAFNISVIADISCDVGDPIPSTLRASTIEEPFYGYNATSEKESKPFDKENITVMAVDNLPGELPRDASQDFGAQLIENILPLLINPDDKKIIERATIVRNGMLTDRYSYLKDYAGL